jgi:Effector Associated Constant Component 1
VDLHIQVSGERETDEYVALMSWLVADPDLQGRVRSTRAAIGETELGGAFELITVTLGSGGVGAALAHTLGTWLASRRSDVKLTVKSRDRTVVLDTKRVSDVPLLISEILRNSDAP